MDSLRMSVFSTQTSYRPLCCTPSSCNEGSGLSVYVARTPLRSSSAPLLHCAFSLAAPFGLHHYFTIMRLSSHSQCMVFDFQPLSPDDPFIASVALLGSSIPGIVQEREVLRIPKRGCWWVGKTLPGRSVEDVRFFNSHWETQLRLWEHDCRHYTESLVEFLTGKQKILQQLNNLPNYEVANKD